MAVTPVVALHWMAWTENKCRWEWELW